MRQFLGQAVCIFSTRHGFYPILGYERCRIDRREAIVVRIIVILPARIFRVGGCVEGGGDGAWSLASSGGSERGPRRRGTSESKNIACRVNERMPGHLESKLEWSSYFRRSSTLVSAAGGNSGRLQNSQLDVNESAGLVSGLKGRRFMTHGSNDAGVWACAFGSQTLLAWSLSIDLLTPRHSALQVARGCTPTDLAALFFWSICAGSFMSWGVSALSS